MNRWVEDHGPDGLYPKFTVTQNSTGQKINQDTEFVFVLRPERDYAAFEALHKYADAVEYRAPNLAGQIRAKLGRIANDQLKPKP